MSTLYQYIPELATVAFETVVFSAVLVFLDLIQCNDSKVQLRHFLMTAPSSPSILKFKQLTKHQKH